MRKNYAFWVIGIKFALNLRGKSLNKQRKCEIVGQIASIIAYVSKKCVWKIYTIHFSNAQHFFDFLALYSSVYLTVKKQHSWSCPQIIAIITEGIFRLFCPLIECIFDRQKPTNLNCPLLYCIFDRQKPTKLKLSSNWPYKRGHFSPFCPLI